VGNTLLSYIVGSDRLIEIITDDPANHTTGLAFMVGFTLLFYAIFARFREQACTFICPYGRFQSALLDENTMVVAYDPRRGERRAPWKRDQQPAARREEGIGDCVNCHACVAVCPTGIDIRNGTQMECVNCAACIDACDAVMDKIGLRRGLVRYASLNGIERGESLRFTPRMRLYAVVLAGLISLFLFLVFTRAEVQTILLRAPGALFQTAADGRISNLYTVKVLNKSNRRLPIRFRLENTDGTLVTMGGAELFAEKAGLAQTSLIVTMDPRKLRGVSTRIRIGVYSGEKRLETVRTSFVGPRTGGR
jgi:cytochrome c oxidase accessory protein FixG